MTVPSWVLTSSIRLYVEAWDETTSRLIWQLDEAARSTISSLALSDPVRLAITRSSSGSPVTPLDGKRIFLSDIQYDVSVGVPILTTVSSATDVLGGFPGDGIPFPVDVAEEVRTEGVRPYADVASVYDRNLTPARTYYYSLFLFLEPEEGGDKEWFKVSSAHCRLPGEFDHGGKLFSLVPPFYQTLDNEYSPTGERGDLAKFLDVVGQELDTTRALAENIQGVYDVDRTDERLLRLLGETNFGKEWEPALGPVRYRSIMSSYTSAVRQRGSLRGVRTLAQAASQYPTKAVHGANLLRTTEDAAFSPDTGLWTVDNDWVTEGWGGPSIETVFYNVGGFPPSAAMTLTTGSGDMSFPTPNGTYASLTADASDAEFIGGIVYGYGQKTDLDAGRFHEPVQRHLDPMTYGLPVRTDRYYTFSAYIKTIDRGFDTGDVFVGMILWTVDDDGESGNIGLLGTWWRQPPGSFMDRYTIVPANTRRGTWVDRPGANPKRYFTTVAPALGLLSAVASPGFTFTGAEPKIRFLPCLFFTSPANEHRISGMMVHEQPTHFGVADTGLQVVK